ncbi:response regulator [Chryseolinea sp. T2]|uniref:response regulator n=1 Tax=Chryseolinea sp. T2 TaxID=3129255 RepID=UPI003077B312
MHIVIIDDDSDEIEFMRVAVEACYPDATCTTFNDCHPAIAALKQTDLCPDYIFVDVNMRKIDGEECLNIIRGYEHLCNSKVIMMSSSMRLYEKKAKNFIANGAFAIAEKPDDLDEYGRMFSSVIGK